MGKMAWLTLALAAFVQPVAAADDLISSQLVDQARHWQQKNRDDIAADLWRKLLRTSPGHPEALVKLGAIEARAGNIKEAEALYNRATQLAKPAIGLSELSTALRTAKGLRPDLPTPPALQEQQKPGPKNARTKRDEGPANKVVGPPATNPQPMATAKPAIAGASTTSTTKGNVNTAVGDPKLKFSTSLDLGNVKPRP